MGTPLKSFGKNRDRCLLRTLVFACASLASSAALQGQTPANAAGTAATSLELPVLIVDHQHRPVGDITLEGLKVKTGTGTPFAPLSLRKEGEDPVSFAIVIDASRDSFHDLYKLGDEFASLVGSVLLPNDRITMYAIDCAMTRSMNGVPPDSTALKKGVTDALNVPTLHEGKTHSSCGKTVHLWDDVAAAAAGLSHAPGRRVLLLISGGADGASKYDWLTVEQYAFDQGVAIFALRDQRQSQADDYTRQSLSVSNGAAGFHSTISPTPAARTANDLELLCANDGGLTLSSAPEFRRDGLADILFLVRQRFILTIPKDAYQPGTSHSAKIIPSALTPYFITATGATEPVGAK